MKQSGRFAGSTGGDGWRWARGDGRAGLADPPGPWPELTGGSSWSALFAWPTAEAEQLRMVMSVPHVLTELPCDAATLKPAAVQAQGPLGLRAVRSAECVGLALNFGAASRRKGLAERPLDDEVRAGRSLRDPRGRRRRRLVAIRAEVSSVLLRVLLITLVAAPVQAQSTRSPSGAFVPFVGAGRFPRPRDVESGATNAGQLLLGAALELSSSRGTALLSIARGVQPFACAGGCAPDGFSAEAAVLAHIVRAYHARAALSVGAVAGYNSFDGRRGTFGLAASAGAVRGFGPRFLLRYDVLSGGGGAPSLAGWFGLRLGS